MVSQPPARRTIHGTVVRSPLADDGTPMIHVGYLPDGRPVLRPLTIQARPAGLATQPAVQPRQALRAGAIAAGVTLALGLLALCSWGVWTVITAVGSFFGWVAANGTTLLGGAVALLVLLAVVGRPVVSVVQKVTIR